MHLTDFDKDGKHVNWMKERGKDVDFEAHHYIVQQRCVACHDKLFARRESLCVQRNR